MAYGPISAYYYYYKNKDKDIGVDTYFRSYLLNNDAVITKRHRNPEYSMTM